MPKFQFTDTLVKAESPDTYFMPTGYGPHRDFVLAVPVDQREEWAKREGKLVTVTVESND